jgi:aminopeptidase-like protein
MNKSSPGSEMNMQAQAMLALMTELFPICRSITGSGLRQTLHILQQHIPLELHEVPSGTAVFDWNVPKEWNISDAYVLNSRGEKVIDFRQSNLHILNYSIPFQGVLPLSELKTHLYSIPDQPDLVPYRTSYYAERWGFCLSHNQLQALEEGDYEVCIQSTLEDGHLTYGEYFLPGESEAEVLISCHSCHPSLCNDNLSGVALATFLAKSLSQRTTRPHYSYRFLFIPGTIGSITWLALHEQEALRIQHGLVVACVGDGGQSHYKRSRRGNAEVDRAVEHILAHSGQPYEIQDFSPYGYDERQYCSPGFNLAVGSLTRTPHGRFPEYHTSADNLDFVQPDCLLDSYEKYAAVIDVLEKNRTYVNTSPKGEPRLGKRGLYGGLSGSKDPKTTEMALLWVLNLSDGDYSLLDIAERSGMSFSEISAAADALFKAGLLVEKQGTI